MKLKYLLLSNIFLFIFGMGANAEPTEEKIIAESDRITLLAAIERISQEYEVYFTFDMTLVSDVEVEYENLSHSSAEEAISFILKGTNLKYKFYDRRFVILYREDAEGLESLKQMSRHLDGLISEGERTITAAPKKENRAVPRLSSKFLSREIQRIAFTVEGKVVDQDGEPLIGVNIQMKGSNKGTATDFDGNFILEDIDENAVLVISYVGYQTQEVSIAGKSILEIVMASDSQLLDEVVVIGYGTQKKATLTGAISNTRGEELRKVPSINFSNAFAGKLPGLTVVTKSGEPGSDNSTFRIRGENTLGNNNPLVVIDGIPNRDMNRLNPGDIESITVLKDASAAIYGAQAANGVILITTKRGEEGKPKISFDLNQGWNMPTVLPKMADAATYAELVNEINLYDGNPSRYSEDDIQKYRDGSDPWNYPNTDWYEEAMGKSSLQQYANIDIRGGSEWLKYFVSMGANFQDGIYKNSATKYNQGNFRANLDGKMSDHIKLSFDISGRQENRNYPTRSASDIFSMLMRSYPNSHAYWPNGLYGPDIALGNNPVVITTKESGYNKRKDYVLESIVSLDISIPWIDGLSFTGNASIDKNFRNRKLWEIPWTLYTWNGQALDSNGEPDLEPAQRGFESPQLTQNMIDGQRIMFNGLLNYNLNINKKHDIGILLGSERISADTTNFLAFRKHFVSTAIDELFAGGEAEKDSDGSASIEARLNYFGRINYNYSDKYLAEFVWRYDGSYIFPKEKRFGFFPGISIGWVVSEEFFWKNNLKPIDYFKLRGSWGQTGNDRIETYQYLSSYGFSDLNYVFGSEEKGLTELRIPNPNVTWEVADQFDIGIDLETFNGRIDFTADYFHYFRSNILWRRNASVPESTGLSLPRENIGEVSNRGFDFALGYNNDIRDLNYRISLNAGYAKNRIRFWDETPGVPEYQQSTGMPMNAQLNYVAIGVFQNEEDLESYPHWEGAKPGDIIFEDVNGDGKIDGLDRVRSDKTELPTFTGGLTFDLSWKNFYASTFFQWATGAERYRYYEMQGEAGNFLARDAEQRWTADNPSTSNPRIWNRYFGYWREQRNTYWLESSDYLRLKNLVIGYDLGSLDFFQRSGFEDLRIYLSGYNILTFTKMNDFDPETTSPTAYPLNKIYNIGISFTF